MRRPRAGGGPVSLVIHKNDHDTRFPPSRERRATGIFALRPRAQAQRGAIGNGCVAPAQAGAQCRWLFTKMITTLGSRLRGNDELREFSHSVQERKRSAARLETDASPPRRRGPSVVGYSQK